MKTGAYRSVGSRFVLATVGMLALLVASSCSGEKASEFVIVRIGGATFRAELALTVEQRSLGLGGRDALARDAGMLFVLPAEDRASFWMRGMRFPLDFVWISGERRVLQVTERVPPPEEGTAGSALPLYRPDEPVRYVLEINGGLADELGISVTDAVTFEPEVDIGRAR